MFYRNLNLYNKATQTLTLYMVIIMRYKDMDLARAVFMILGIIFHASLVYRPSTSWSFFISSEDSHFLFSIISSILHDFRMHGFYLIAGFFTALSLNKKDKSHFLKDRFVRLGIPMLFVGFTLNAVMLKSLPDHKPVDITNFILNGKWLVHLWFLGNLLVYILICYFLNVDSLFRKIKIKYNNIFLTGITTIITISLVTVVLNNVGSLSEKDVLLFISLERLFIYFPIFLSGIFFYYNFDLYKDITKLKNSTKTLTPFICLFILSKHFGLEKESKEAYMFFDLSYNIALSFTVLGLLSYISKSLNIHKSLISSSYSVYLLHIPFIAAFLFLIEPLNLNVFFAFILLSSLTFLACYLSHILLIKNSRLLLFLFNGQIAERLSAEPQKTTCTKSHGLPNDTYHSK